MNEWIEWMDATSVSLSGICFATNNNDLVICSKQIASILWYVRKTERANRRRKKTKDLSENSTKVQVSCISIWSNISALRCDVWGCMNVTVGNKINKFVCVSLCLSPSHLKKKCFCWFLHRIPPHLLTVVHLHEAGRQTPYYVQCFGTNFSHKNTWFIRYWYDDLCELIYLEAKRKEKWKINGN